MSFKTTGVLLLLLALLGGYVYYFVLNKPPQAPQESAPFVYSVDMQDIQHMELTYQGKTISLDWDEGKSQWNFADPTLGKVDGGRVNGIRLLLSGPGSKRALFKEKVEDLSPYSLDKPQIVAKIKLKDGRANTLLIGNTTPNGLNYYVKNEGFDPIYLVDYTWGDELARFVTEPPISKEQ